jgi:Holliday junction resolvase-like predicted endonuclease
MSARNRIIALLRTHPDGLDDDVIAERLGFSRRQQANSRCRELEREGIVERRSVAGKIRNILTGSAVPVRVCAEIVTPPADVDPEKPWCWEGTVVRAVASFLTARGWSIETIANTETGEPGADIKARRSDSVLIVEVKGYPSKTYERGPKKGQPKRTNPATQARHWFAEALLTALLRQAASRQHHVAIALPEFAVYTKLLSRVTESLKLLGLVVLLVQESGTVVIVQDEKRAV